MIEESRNPIMSMEYFAYNWMELFFGDRKDDYLKMHLEDSAAFVPYGCMVDLSLIHI